MNVFRGDVVYAKLNNEVVIAIVGEVYNKTKECYGYLYTNRNWSFCTIKRFRFDDITDFVPNGTYKAVYSNYAGINPNSFCTVKGGRVDMVYIEGKFKNYSSVSGAIMAIQEKNYLNFQNKKVQLEEGLFE